jgi:hypothetical protein
MRPSLEKALITSTVPRATASSMSDGSMLRSSLNESP